MSIHANVMVIVVMKRIITGNLRYIDRILSKSIISNYNYDGVKGKKSLKRYSNVLNAIYESTKSEGYTYDKFIKDLRLSLHRFKNTINRSNSRKKIEDNKENDDILP
ncbi:hypothetical protein FF38_05126 [Lucilia cuprina]|uniref:DUF4806 domain-containing protein n=1 Tax=Lucilia cuprina TaxID=7375 RepID=A0A0L0C5N9_LUCCU|nr:hypothetical protein FF38_05126 [Lucilia cuprina]